VRPIIRLSPPSSPAIHPRGHSADQEPPAPATPSAAYIEGRTPKAAATQRARAKAAAAACDPPFTIDAEGQQALQGWIA